MTTSPKQNTRIRFTQGEIIFREGMASDKAYLVEKGKVKLIKKRDGKELVLERVTSSGIFGEMSLIDGTARSASAIAEEETICVVVDEQEFQKRLKETDSFLCGVFRILVARLRGTTERLSMTALPEQIAVGQSRSSQRGGTASAMEPRGDMRSADDRLEKLGNDLLYFSRLKTAEPVLREMNPRTIISGLDVTLEPFLKAHHACIDVPAPMPSMMCDKEMITDVFRHLITNAVQYNEAAKKVVEIGFLKSVASTQGEAQNVFYVKDNGVGIAPESHQEIFHVFKRLHQPPQANEYGAGMGLAFVERIVHRHKGRVWLDSQPGKGTVFYFTLN